MSRRSAHPETAILGLRWGTFGMAKASINTDKETAGRPAPNTLPPVRSSRSSGAPKRPLSVVIHLLKRLGLLVLPLTCTLAATLLSAQAPMTIPVVPDSSIRVDGVLDEAFWQTALAIELSYEVRPGENIAPPVATTVLLSYDQDHLLVGFRCLDPDPEQIRARFRERDNAWGDDFVGVVLDTFNDERRAFELMANPLGVQIDAVNDEVGGDYDTSWDAIWQSAGRITATGYEVEFAIPFRQLRFQPSAEAQTWGFDAVRSYPRVDRHHIGSFPRERGQNDYLSKAHKIRGFSSVQAGLNLELVPTITGARVDQRNPSGGFDSVDEEADLGFSGRWGVTPNWTLSGTVNPDFSQVEADVLKLDVNQQFTIFFPETRPFFLEGADTFATDLNLVHTRTVSDPSAAIKITGKQGKHTVGTFTARDQVANVLVPGSQGSRSASFDQTLSASAARYRYDLGTNSTIGALLTERSGNGYSNRVGATDMRWRPTKRDSLRLQTAFSDTRYNAAMVDAFGLEATDVGGYAIEGGYSHSRRNWNFNFNFQDRDKDFRADLGFLPQVDVRGFDSDAGYVWHGDETTAYNQLSTAAWVYNKQRQSGELLVEGFGINARGEFARETSAQIHAISETRRFGGRDFELVHGGFNASMRPTPWLRLSANGNLGDWIDFAGIQPADQTAFRLQAHLSLGRRFASRLVYNYSALDAKGSRLFIARAPEVRLLYYFNRRLYVRLIGQFTSVDTDPEAIGSATTAVREDLLTQLLGVYEVNPRTALFVGYGDTWDNEDTQLQPGGILEAPNLRRQSRAFFVKLGYSWQP